MNRHLAALIAFGLCLPIATVRAEVAHGGGTAPPASRVSVLVELVPGADRADVLRFAEDRGGLCRYQYERLAHVVNLRGMPVDSLERLGRHPAVLRLRPDPQYHVLLDESTALVRAAEDQLDAYDLPFGGAGQRVCVIDTGIDGNHTMYSARIDSAAGFDFVNDDPDPEDDHGHGSHVAGIALGRSGFSVGGAALQGVAPQATLIGVKVLGSTGSGFGSDVIAGLEHCADPALPGGPADVVNLSLGAGSFAGVCDDDLVAQAANAAVAAGVVVVASAGNGGGANNIGSPACGSAVIAVAATYDADYPGGFSFGSCSDAFGVVDELTCFSDRSAQVDVAAPGCLTFSADAFDASGNGITGKCGTSMSAPHVSGLAALIGEADAGLGPVEIRAAIRDGAIDLGPPGYDTGYGHGRIDAIGSLKRVVACIDAADCDDGLYCNGPEQCLGGSCVADPPCAGQRCGEEGQGCLSCDSALECDNSVVCDGVEQCAAGICAPGPVDCGIVCNPDTNTCTECIDDPDCDDGSYCSGTEFCDAGGICRLDIRDCNDNGVEDVCDVVDMTSADLGPPNGVPDECDAAVRYRLTPIPTLGGPRSRAFALNDAGAVVGAAETGEASTSGLPIEHAFVWDAGAMTDLGTLGGDDSRAEDINNQGVVAGTADLQEPITPPEIFGFAANQPVVWDVSGAIQQLTLPAEFGNWNGGAHGLNETGEVAGQSILGFESIGGVVWDAAGQPETVEVAQADVWSINNQGHSVGWMVDQAVGGIFSRHAFYWKGGKPAPSDLGTLGGNWSWALDINDAGQIVGEAVDASGLVRPFLTTLTSSMLDLGSLDGVWARARALNELAEVVGYSTHPQSSSIFDGRAFIWSAGTIEDLNDLIPGNFGFVLRDAHDINESGQIVGWGLDTDGLERGYLLTPCGAGDSCFEIVCAPAPVPPVPAAVGGLRLERLFAGSAIARLSWQPEELAQLYRVYRGTQSDLSDLGCFRSGLQLAGTTDDGAIPPSGTLDVYLVTAVNCGGESTFAESEPAGGRPAPAGCP